MRGATRFENATPFQNLSFLQLMCDLWLLNGHKMFQWLHQIHKKILPFMIIYNNVSLYFVPVFIAFWIPNSHAWNIIHRKNRWSYRNIEQNILFYILTFVCCEIEIIPRLIRIVECCTVHRTKCSLVHCTICNAWINPYNNWYAFIVWLLAAHKNENKSFMISSFFCLLLFNSLYTLIPFKRKNDRRKCYRNMKKWKKKKIILYCINEMLTLFQTRWVHAFSSFNFPINKIHFQD